MWFSRPDILTSTAGLGTKITQFLLEIGLVYLAFNIMRLMQLVHQEWWTNAEAKTNEQGEAIIRGFYGQYLLTIKSGTQAVQKLIHLKTSKDNIFEVRLP